MRDNARFLCLREAAFVQIPAGPRRSLYLPLVAKASITQQATSKFLHTRDTLELFPNLIHFSAISYRAQKATPCLQIEGAGYITSRLWKPHLKSL